MLLIWYMPRRIPSPRAVIIRPERMLDVDDMITRHEHVGSVYSMRAKSGRLDAPINHNSAPDKVVVKEV